MKTALIMTLFTFSTLGLSSEIEISLDTIVSLETQSREVIFQEEIKNSFKVHNNKLEISPLIKNIEFNNGKLIDLKDIMHLKASEGGQDGGHG